MNISLLSLRLLCVVSSWSNSIWTGKIEIFVFAKLKTGLFLLREVWFLWISSMGATYKLYRNSESQGSPKTYWIRLCILTRFLVDSFSYESLRSTTHWCFSKYNSYTCVSEWCYRCTLLTFTQHEHTVRPTPLSYLSISSS